jgi:hypothetical protein
MGGWRHFFWEISRDAKDVAGAGNGRLAGLENRTPSTPWSRRRIGDGTPLQISSKREGRRIGNNGFKGFCGFAESDYILFFS